MARKKASPSKEQVKVLENNGLNKLTWVVIKDLDDSMIVKHRITGEVRHIKK